MGVRLRETADESGFGVRLRESAAESGFGIRPRGSRLEVSYFRNQRLRQDLGSDLGVLIWKSFWGFEPPSVQIMESSFTKSSQTFSARL